MVKVGRVTQLCGNRSPANHLISLRPAGFTAAGLMYFKKRFRRVKGLDRLRGQANFEFICILYDQIYCCNLRCM